ncbi:uncharacterized protein F4807DRAFT_216404 [Annulohypoxylon truncatum]|uniref:uncharacterized protein n=1 Tax=Annulohypoxylon truncatum TaxID=327061 RepID=UPI0020073F7F|nr:uncharacterized protein F4807DRAFT_216404 [Annulohypoxylon truncatum]KAI1206833.1 hypothetical protein F4807DRAFT_216404 [Annulohypoxylon truncatum]
MSPHVNSAIVILILLISNLAVGLPHGQAKEELEPVPADIVAQAQSCCNHLRHALFRIYAIIRRIPTAAPPC